jgi:hypothetical protein
VGLEGVAGWGAGPGPAAVTEAYGGRCGAGLEDRCEVRLDERCEARLDGRGEAWLGELEVEAPGEGPYAVR